MRKIKAIKDKNVLMAIILTTLLILGSILLIFSSKEAVGKDNLKEYNQYASQVFTLGKGYSMNKEVLEKQSEKKEKKEKLKKSEGKNENIEIEQDEPEPEPKKEKDEGKKTEGKNISKGDGNKAVEEEEEEEQKDFEEAETIYDKKTPKKRIPSFETSLRSGLRIRGLRHTFTVSAKDYKGNSLNSFRINVNVNDEKLYRADERGGVVSYRGKFKNGENIVSISVRDENGYTITRKYKVYADENKKPKPKGTITIRVEARSVGKGILINNYKVQFYDGDSYASLLVKVLEKYGYRPIFKGNGDYSFYLSAIEKSGIGKNTKIPEALKEKLKDEGVDLDEGEKNDNRLGEFNFTDKSGWTWTLNNKYMDVGMSEPIVKDKAVMLVRYTIYFGYEYDGTWFNGSW